MHTKGRYSLTIGFVSLYPLQQYKRGERRIGKNSWDGNAEVLVSKGTPTISLPAHTSSVYVIYRSEDTDPGVFSVENRMYPKNHSLGSGNDVIFSM